MYSVHTFVRSSRCYGLPDSPLGAGGISHSGVLATPRSFAASCIIIVVSGARLKGRGLGGEYLFSLRRGSAEKRLGNEYPRRAMDRDWSSRCNRCRETPRGRRRCLEPADDTRLGEDPPDKHRTRGERLAERSQIRHRSAAAARHRRQPTDIDCQGFSTAPPTRTGHRALFSSRRGHARNPGWLFASELNRWGNGNTKRTPPKRPIRYDTKPQAQPLRRSPPSAAPPLRGPKLARCETSPVAIETQRRRRERTMYVPYRFSPFDGLLYEWQRRCMARLRHTGEWNIITFTSLFLRH